MTVSHYVYVSNSLELKAAMAARTNDTVIVLKEGAYGAVTINEKGGLRPVTLVAENPSKPPVFESLSINNANNVKLDGLQFSPEKTGTEGWAGSGLTVRNSSGVEVVNSKFVGSENSFVDSARGMTIFDSKNVSVENNSFNGLTRGGVFYNINGLDVISNKVTNMRSEGFDFSAVQNVEIAHNDMSEFRPFVGDHADFIQFWTRGAKAASENISIHHNKFVEMSATIQGIFMDNDDHIPYKNVTIENNWIQTNAPRGITLVEAEGVRVSNNLAVGVPNGDYKVSISITDSVGLHVSGNTSNALSLLNSRDVVEHGNVTVALTAAANVSSSTDLTSIREAMNEINGTADIDRLTGSKRDDIIDAGRGNDVVNGSEGHDVIIGGVGNDMLSGGAGADTFVFRASDITGKESDRIFDLNFADGDAIEFAGFSSILGGADASVTIDSWAALAALANDSDVVVSRKGTTELLIVTVNEGPNQIQEIVISNAYTAYKDAGGLLI